MRSFPSSKSDSFVPPVLDITEEDFHEVYPDWVRWRATARRFLPTELRKQPETLMDKLLYIDSVYEAMLNQFMQDKEDD